MKKDNVHRIFRIVITTIFLVVATFLRNDVAANYEAAEKVMASMPSIAVTSLSSDVDTSNGLIEKHDIEIKNVSNGKKDVTFVFKETNDNFPYNYLNYTIIKNGKTVKKGIVKKDNVLYKEKMSINEDNIYTIILSITRDDVYNLGGVSISGKLAFI